MTAPGWLVIVLAALMLAIAACCAGRLVLGLRRRHTAEPSADVLHVLMGTSMAGMLEPRLAAVPGTTWLVVFAAAVLWFGGQLARGRNARSRCAHPVPHAVESVAMVYMLAMSRPGSAGSGMAMAGMSAGTPIANPALTLVLVLFMLGYALWTTDQLTSLSRARPASTAAASVLAPRFAASYKIVMSAAMGVMLLTML